MFCYIYYHNFPFYVPHSSIAAEFFDQGSSDLVGQYLGHRNPLEESSPFYVLVETTGSNEQHDTEVGAYNMLIIIYITCYNYYCQGHIFIYIIYSYILYSIGIDSRVTGIDWKLFLRGSKLHVKVYRELKLVVRETGFGSSSDCYDVLYCSSWSLQFYFVKITYK